MVPQSTGYFKQSRLASTQHLVLVSLGTSLKALLRWKHYAFTEITSQFFFTEQECHLYVSIGALNQNGLHSGEARQTCLGFHVWSSGVNTSAHTPCTKKEEIQVRLYTVPYQTIYPWVSFLVYFTSSCWGLDILSKNNTSEFHLHSHILKATNPLCTQTEFLRKKLRN